MHRKSAPKVRRHLNQHLVLFEKTSKQQWPLERGHQVQLSLRGPSTDVAGISGLGLFQRLAAPEEINKWVFFSSFFFFFKKKKQSANSLLSYLLPGRGRGGKQLAWSLQPYPDKRDVALLMYNSCRLLNCLHLPNVEFVTCPRRALLALLTWPDLEALGTQPHPPTSHRPRLSLAEGWLKGPLPSSLLLAPLSLWFIDICLLSAIRQSGLIPPPHARHSY